MGGAGGTVYETPDGPRTGAYLASRIARDVVEAADAGPARAGLEPERARPRPRTSAARSRQALEDRLAELKAPPSRLRSQLLRALPTTMAVIALQRTHRGGSTWTGHVFWAGDSRAYVFEPRRGSPAQHRRPARPRRRHGQPAPRLGGQQRDVGRHRLPRQLPPGRAGGAVPGGLRDRRLLRLPARRRCTSSTWSSRPCPEPAAPRRGRGPSRPRSPRSPATTPPWR